MQGLMAMVLVSTLVPGSAAPKSAETSAMGTVAERTMEHSLERSHGGGNKLLRGAGLGFLAGAALGTAYGVIGHPGTPHADEFSPGAETAMLAAFFGLCGLLAGTVVGGLSETRRATPPSFAGAGGVRVGIAPLRGGAAVKLAISF